KVTVTVLALESLTRRELVRAFVVLKFALHRVTARRQKPNRNALHGQGRRALTTHGAVGLCQGLFTFASNFGKPKPGRLKRYALSPIPSHHARTIARGLPRGNTPHTRRMSARPHRRGW